MKTIFTHSEEGLTITGKLTPDETKLFIDAVCTPTRHVEYGELVKALLAYTPIELIHTDVLNDVASLLSKGEKVLERRIAKGIAPEPGVDGKLVFLARRILTKGGKILVKEHGTAIDVENILEKRQLARVYKPKPGAPGKNALGSEIPAPMGKPIEIRIQGSIVVDKVDEHYDVLVAGRNGYFSDDSGELAVYDEMSFEGDFDHRFGAVDFIGAVSVSGDVKTNSFITAVKGVTINGTVSSNVTIRTSDGPIVIRGAINGGKSTRFYAGGNFECVVIEQSEVEATGTIRIKKEAHSNELRTRGYCIAKGAHMFGGILYTSEGIIAKKLGNNAGVKTTVFLCADIETQKDFQLLLERIVSHEKAVHLLELHLGPMLKNPSRVVLLQPVHRQRIEALFAKHAEVTKSHKALLDKKEGLLSAASRKEELAVSIESIMHSGCIVTNGPLEWTTHEDKKGPFAVILRKDAEEFVIGDLIQPPEDTKEKSNDAKRSK